MLRGARCLVTAYCSFFVGDGLGKAGKNPAYSSLAATAATSNIDIKTSSDRVIVLQCEPHLGGGCNNGPATRPASP
jgi:hypothetical protein